MRPQEWDAQVVPLEAVPRARSLLSLITQCPLLHCYQGGPHQMQKDAGITLLDLGKSPHVEHLVTATGSGRVILSLRQLSTKQW